PNGWLIVSAPAGCQRGVPGGRPPGLAQTAKPVIPGAAGDHWLVGDGPQGCPPPSYAAGPLARVTVAVCDCSDWSTELIEILSPGWYFTRIWLMSVAEETDWPATEVIVSPSVRPALSAGEPDRVPEMVAPLLALLPLPSPWPKPPNPL